jgi:hypothetical protein
MVGIKTNLFGSSWPYLFIYIGTTIQVVESRVQQTYDSSRESKP